MTDIPDILNDEREIRCIGNPASDTWDYEIGRYGVTKIAAYGEPGMTCYLPEFAVYTGDEILARVPAWTVSVHYVIQEVPA